MRLVLRLPGEAGDRRIGCAAVCRAAYDRVGVTGNAQPRLHGTVGRHVRQDRRVGGRLDEPSAKDGGRNGENDVAISALAGVWISSRSKIWLSDVAARRVSASSDDEEVVHAAVGRSIRISLEAASRIGPLFVMNHGNVFFAPLSLATAIKGFAAGLVPPTAGCKWQDEHWLELKRGPSPLLSPPVTTSRS